MNDHAMLRRYVREVMAPHGVSRQWSERKIFDAVDRLTRDALEVGEMHAAIAWNEARGFVASTPDEDSARPGVPTPLLWSITPAGRAKEGLS